MVSALRSVQLTELICVLLGAADGPSGLHRYKLRLLFDAVEMRWDWPVDVNHHEAQVRSSSWCWDQARQHGPQLGQTVYTYASGMR